MERISQQTLEGAISFPSVRKSMKEGLERAYYNAVLSWFQRGSEGMLSGGRETNVVRANNEILRGYVARSESRPGKQPRAVKPFTVYKKYEIFAY